MKNTSIQPVTYEQWQRLKELGFDWNGQSHPVKYFISGRSRIFHVPSVALALKWFRDVHGYQTCIFVRRYMEEHLDIRQTNEYCIEAGKPSEKIPVSRGNLYRYEDAESALLTALLDLVSGSSIDAHAIMESPASRIHAQPPVAAS